MALGLDIMYFQSYEKYSGTSIQTLIVQYYILYNNNNITSIVLCIIIFLFEFNSYYTQPTIQYLADKENRGVIYSYIK